MLKSTGICEVDLLSFDLPFARVQNVEGVGLCRQAYSTMLGISCSMYNLKHLKRGLQVLLTLLSHAQSEVEWRLGSRSARGCATELGLFLLLWHCRLAPSSICSFGTYSCNDYEQSLIKLQRTLPRNQCVSVYGDDHLLISFSLFVCSFACVSLLCVCPLLKSVCTAGVYAYVWLIGAYPNSKFDSLGLSEALLLVLLSLSCRQHGISMLSSHRMENGSVFQQSTGAYITVIKACVKEGMDDAMWFFFSPIFTFSVIYFVHKEFLYDWQLGYKSHNNTAAPKTIIWISYAGELVSHPQRGVLQLFIYKDA